MSHLEPAVAKEDAEEITALALPEYSAVPEYVAADWPQDQWAAVEPPAAAIAPSIPVGADWTTPGLSSTQFLMFFLPFIAYNLESDKILRRIIS